ncbi:MAG: hypothetical protein KatS3mg105_2805 [Gemmatales bacterium]|nr:MAG: hypothetical protein KatS3mg105_2805 [Gemmatales bacterium]
MPQQLDDAGSAVLRQHMENLGVRVHLQTAVKRILGNGRVSGIQLQDDSVLECDMVIVACGIRPNVEEAKAAGLRVERGIVVDDQLRTSDPAVFAVGECAQHRDKIYGLVEPAYEQARVVADILAETNPDARYHGSRPVTILKVMGVDLISMGDVAGGNGAQVVSQLDAGVYRKLVVRDNKLAGAILLGVKDKGARLERLFRSGQELSQPPLELLLGSKAQFDSARDMLLAEEDDGELLSAPEETQICNCNAVCKGTILQAIAEGKNTVQAIGAATKAGTGCGTCRPLLSQLLAAQGISAAPTKKNPVEAAKEEKDGLDSLSDIYRLAENNRWQEMTDADKHRFKWYGLFFRPPTPGYFMLRLRFQAGRSHSKQFRTLADIADEFGKSFCDLTTRQQIQLRWFTLEQTPEIWKRLDAVGLHSKQTGMDNVRGVVGCPLAGLTPHELLDATPVIREFDDIIVGNKEYTNLPRKFNVTITGCMENCCHAETQDIGLVPAYKELEGRQVNGFNVLVGGKQGSGGYKPAKPLDVFTPPDQAAKLCAAIVQIFRDHGSRAARPRARLSFLIEDRGIRWFRSELEKTLAL